MLADGAFLVMRRAGDGPVDIRKLAAVFGVPFPDLSWRVIGKSLGHGCAIPQVKSSGVGG